MIDKTIGVIPSRSELSSLTDKKTENFHDTKSEFESYFNQLQKDRPDNAYGGIKKNTQEPEKKLADKSEKTKKPDENKESKDEREEKGVVRKRKEKLTDNEMVLLANMASQENVDKTPDSEVNLDHLEEISPIKISDLTEEPVQVQSEMTLPELAKPQQEAVFNSAMDGAEFVTEVTEPAATSEPAVIELPDAPEALVATVAPEVTEQPVVETKVLEALNREQLFKKLDNMVKTDTVEADVPTSAVEMPVAQTAKPDTEAKSQDESSSQSGFSEANTANALNSQSLHTGVGTDHTKNFVATMAAANKTDAPQAADAESSLKDIISQARYLVTQGGGEVSVKMSPEGMGEVHLKMMLENGKVNVEMHTQDKNVQKLIQESLSDLKSSLAAHQISVEHVTLNNKISTVQDVQQSSDMRSSLDSGQNSQSGGNAFAQFHHNENLANQRQSQREAHQVFQNNGLKTVMEKPLNDVRKAVAHKVYQSHKAQSLNAVA